jgi:two-component system chemotaxis response regulator CheY
MRTLIVDDEYICRRVLQEMVKPYGTVEAVSCGADAITAFGLAVAEKRPFHLVCLDYEMPGLHGLETLAKLREIEEQHGIVGRHAARVVMTTVRKDPGLVFASFRHQAEAYLIKPVTQDALLGTLKKFRLIADE